MTSNQIDQTLSLSLSQIVRGVTCKKYERRFKNVDFGPLGKISVNVLRYYQARFYWHLFQIDFEIYSDDFITKVPI